VIKTIGEEVAQIIERHLIKHWMYFKNTQESIHIDNATLKYISAPPYNRVLYTDWLGLKKQHQEATVHQLIKHCDQEGEPLLWMIGPSTKSFDLDKALINMGLRHHENWIGMVKSLTDYTLANSYRHDFIFKRVMNEDDLKKWVDVYVRGYGKPTDDKEAIFDRFKQIVKSKQNEYQLYLGNYQNEPAVAGTLFFDHDIAGLYCITTAPQMRRKGLATIYLQNLLDTAKQQGASTCILHATDAGKPAYEKLGFQSVCMFQVYKWNKV
jgi:N-acetylglutamate synthase-like GNAT family acetyltransferase